MLVVQCWWCSCQSSQTYFVPSVSEGQSQGAHSIICCLFKQSCPQAVTTSGSTHISAQLTAPHPVLCEQLQLIISICVIILRNSAHSSVYLFSRTNLCTLVIALHWSLHWS